MNDHEPDLTGMTFHEIAAKYGEEAAIDAGTAAGIQRCAGVRRPARWICRLHS